MFFPATEERTGAVSVAFSQPEHGKFTLCDCHPRRPSLLSSDVMTHRHRHTLEKIFAHPLPTDLPWSRVVALLCGLGASTQATSNSHMKFVLPNGPEITVPVPRHGQLSSKEELVSIRRFLEDNGITPDHPDYHPAGEELPHGCLLLDLAHQESSVYLVLRDGAEVQRIQPYDPWFHRHHLDHRKENTFEGQRAPEQPSYFAELAEACKAANQLLIVGHGSGHSDLRALFLEYLGKSRPEILQKVIQVSTTDDHLTQAQLLALAREAFGAPAPRN